MSYYKNRSDYGSFSENLRDFVEKYTQRGDNVTIFMIGHETKPEKFYLKTPNGDTFNIRSYFNDPVFTFDLQEYILDQIKTWVVRKHRIPKVSFNEEKSNT